MERMLIDDLMDAETGFPFDFLRDSLGILDKPRNGRHAKGEMTIDMQENDDGYTLDISLQDFTKDQIRLELEGGFLTVTAEKYQDRNEMDPHGRVVYQECFTDTLQRSFYVGQTMTVDDVKARYIDGILHLEMPKRPAVPALSTKQIPIKE